MKELMLFIAGAIAFVLLNMSIDSFNPCSNFSNNQQECGKL